MNSQAVQDLAVAADRAAARIGDLVRKTPLDFSAQFSAETGANVYFKLENLQYTGSFKLRGASNKLMTLSSQQRSAGCVAASSGNHGAAVAYAMQKAQVTGVIFVPEQTSSTKVQAIRSYGGDVRYHGSDGLDTELHARAFAEQHGMVYLSPYNDIDVVAGQGSCGVELCEQLSHIDDVFIAVGGGGLISGVGSVLKRQAADTRIIGCQPGASPVMARSVEAGHIVDMPSEATLSDGTAGGIETDAVTFALCREIVDEFVCVGEAEIATAMCQYMDAEHQLIEGAAAVAVAAFLAEIRLHKAEFADRNVVILICGANISRETLQKVIC
jgi:threonine dehydratase